MEKELIKLMFPEGLLDYFEVKRWEKGASAYVFYLDEMNIVPEGFKKTDLESKGFYNEESMNDFPLRGNKCVLKLRRRKWIEKSSGNIVNRDWSIVSKGTRITEEFSIFLKELNRYYTSKL